MRFYALIVPLAAAALCGCRAVADHHAPHAKRMPADAIVGHWRDALNNHADRYFSRDGRTLRISPIKDHFIGTYEIVRQDADERLLELKIVDTVPGSGREHRRRLLGNFSEDYRTFSGRNLSAGMMQFSLEYVDDRQGIPDAESRQMKKYLEEAKENYHASTARLAGMREDIDGTRSALETGARELQERVEELQQQISELRKEIEDIRGGGEDRIVRIQEEEAVPRSDDPGAHQTQRVESAVADAIDEDRQEKAE
ncbi:MAG: hypothetical protein PHN82_05945 [bacterium]|nr:hypothetical protein [bacterium]